MSVFRMIDVVMRSSFGCIRILSLTGHGVFARYHVVRYTV